MEIQYEELENFIFPLIKNVCKPRGLRATDVITLFVAYCPKCSRILNPENLMLRAAASQIGQGIEACPQCGSKKFEAILTTLTPKERQKLSKDRFFSHLSAIKQFIKETKGV